MQLLYLLSMTAATVAAMTVVQLSKAKVGPDAMLRFAQQRHGLRSNDSIARRSAVAPVGDPHEDYLYTTQVILGQGQVFSLQIDTGSSDLWVRSNLGCLMYSGSCFEQPSPNFVGDSTTTNTTQPWSIGYADGSTASGFIFTGPAAIGALTVKNFAFGVALQESSEWGDIPGIIGLGWNSINNIYGKTNKANFVGASAISEFGIYLQNAAQTTDVGELTLGGIDATKYTGSITYIPLNSESYWQFATTGISFSINGGAATAITGTYGSIFDSGTTQLIVPASAYAAISTAIGASGSSIDCSVATTGPVVTFNLNGGIIKISPSVYVLNYFGTCTNGFASSDGFGSDIIFGDVFLRSAYTIYDVANKRVGFAQSNHGGVTTSTIKSTTTTKKTTTTIASTTKKTTTTTSTTKKTTVTTAAAATSKSTTTSKKSTTTTASASKSKTTTSTTTSTIAKTTTTQTCQTIYGQCGGIGWTGPTCCVNSVCTQQVPVNPYYAQCT